MKIVHNPNPTPNFKKFNDAESGALYRTNDPSLRHVTYMKTNDSTMVRMDSGRVVKETSFNSGILFVEVEATLTIEGDRIG